MTGRTHDLVAFTTLSAVFFALPLVQMTPATLFVALLANYIGALAPDLDGPSSSLWRGVRFGKFVKHFTDPLLGAHRTLSHSLIGVLLISIGVRWLLNSISHILIVDMTIVHNAFMIGIVSHLFADALTRQGIPLLFPVPLDFGFPPFRFLRIKSGGPIEKSLIVPTLIATNIYLYYQNYPKLLEFLASFV